MFSTHGRWTICVWVLPFSKTSLNLKTRNERPRNNRKRLRKRRLRQLPTRSTLENLYCPRDLSVTQVKLAFFDDRKTKMMLDEMEKERRLAHASRAQVTTPP